MPESKKISDLKYVVPFGRYVGSHEVEPGADEVLVGREGHRAYFIELLISAGRQGAFLVTGRRGAGKTSFVQHCIAEYEDSVFKRFLRHNVGRAFWDRVMVLLFWAVVLFGGLLLSELAQLLAPLASPGPHRMLLWIVLVPIGVVLLFPCVYARAVFEVVFKRSAGRLRDDPAKTARRTQQERVHATFLVVLWVALAWCLPGLSSPAWAMSAAVTLLAALYIGVQALSFNRRVHSTKRPHDAWERIERWFLGLLLAFATLFTLYSSREWSETASDEGMSSLEALWGSIAINLCVGGGYLAGGLLLRSWYQRRGAFWAFLDAQKGPRRHSRTDPIRQALRRGSTNYAIPGLVLVLVPSVVWAALYPLAPFVGTVAATATIMITVVRALAIESERTCSPGDRHGFRPAPRWILVAGAILSIILALQLAQPIVAPILDHTVRPLVAALQDDLTRTAQLPESSLARVPGLQRISDQPEDEYRGWPVFWHRYEGLLWVGLVLIALSLLHFVQYEWIVRPYVTPREDADLDLEESPPWEDGERSPEDQKALWRSHREMAELTLPWSVYRIWLPTMAVSVNLGFDSRLGADQIIQAMLVGLRDIYNKTFNAWTAGPANIGRLAAVLGLIVLVTLAGDTWFKLPTPVQVRRWSEEAEALRGTAPREPVTPCEILASTRDVRPTLVPDLVCRLGQGWFDLFYLDLAPKQLARASSFATTHPRGMGDTAGQRLLLYSLVPYRDPPAPDEEICGAGAADSPACRWFHAFPPGINLGAFHVLLFFLLLLAARSAFRRLPILPYHQNLKRIDDLLDSMTARTRVTQRPSLWEPARWIYSLVADRVRETERDPLDPRTVELAFLQILNEIQHGGARMPGIARRQLNLPAPEITFVFDELDKLGTRLDPGDDEALALATELQAIQAEHERSLKLRGLLSDLKNVLSSAPARFIFIGGRNLHDEWLADQTARQPLLTNIFIAEVYLPSLLTDRRQTSRRSEAMSQPHRLHTRIEEFVVCQYQRAVELYRNWALKGFRPSFAIHASSLERERFAPGNLPISLASSIEPHLCHHDRRIDTLIVEDSHRLSRDLVAFLTLRSMGNPKRLKELLAGFIRPVGREVSSPGRWQIASRHVLRFRDLELFRIQLTASVYRHLAAAFETRMVDRDDKMAISIFFLSDFLFKFHRRAFSWANLERVDELTHIHRAPDLRDVQEEIVDLFSERFLHRVLNGMYSFRFRSDVAREVEYVSRRSAAEMAALNFTLDESQSLKALYRYSLESREKREGPTPGLVAGLGELYEFDQEYETARHYYRRAIDILDERLCAKAGSPDAVRDLLLGEPSGMDDARVFLPWGEVRLRLMLQIGMTFENTRSHERAVTEYRAARTLARAMVKACLALDQNELPQRFWNELFEQEQTAPSGRRHTLKHMSILLQPVFAEAWASQKITGAVDTANSLLEASIAELRRLLPFVSEPGVTISRHPDRPAHANLALTASQIHNKAGDLYFFKGRQPVLWNDMIRSSFWEAGRKDRETDGYLLRAHYHYAVSLHEIRRFSYHRIESSRYRLSLSSDRAKTLTIAALPDFLWRAVASSVNDMAEATLGRVSIFGLFHYDHADSSEGTLLESEALEYPILDWLGLDDRHANQAADLRLPFLSTSFPLGSRPNWLGKWTGVDSRKLEERSADRESAGRPSRSRKKADRTDLLRFVGADPPAVRLLVAIHLCRAGARFFERGGYLEYAARELLQVVDVVTRVLWWLRSIERLVDWRGAGALPHSVSRAVQELEDAMLAKADARAAGRRKEGFDLLLHHLAIFALDSLSAADRLFVESRRRMTDEHFRYRVGDLIPADCLTLAYSLGLWLDAPAFQDCASRPNYAALRVRTRALIDSWLEHGAAGPPDPSTDLRDALWTSLERHRFPMLNRLNGLELLVNDFVLNRWDDPGEDLEGVRSCVDELLVHNEQYAAPLHFTPQQSGTTCALFYLRARGFNALADDTAFLERVYRTAQHDLRVSEEMFTLRRAFYESISDLYYLYDDFNDRQIHVKHALQMAAAELTSLLSHLLEVAEQPEIRDPAP